MLASTSISTLLLLASAVVSAQDTPSVVTSISITPTPASEEVFTIQTSEPPSATGPYACACIQEPCLACTSDDVMSIPAGETPISTGEIASTIFTNPLRTSESAFPFIPPGETPFSTGSLEIPATASPNATLSSSPTVSGSGLPQQTTNAAVAPKGDGVAFLVGLFGAAVALF